jgi:hypothetical protein
MPFTLFVILIFSIVLIPIVVVLINLSAIMAWVSEKPPGFGENVLALVILIPAFTGLLLCLAVRIIVKKEEQYAVAAHERIKKENPPGYSWEKELRNISGMIDTINCSLEQIKGTSEEIVSLSHTIALINQDQDLKIAPPMVLPYKPLLCMDKFLEMPVSPEVLKIAIEKISQTTEYEVRNAPADKFQKPIPEKEVLSMLLNRLKTEQDFHISR